MCAIPPAGIDNYAIGTSAPDDHGTSRFTSCPHCGVRVSSRGRIGGAGRGPGVCARNVLATRVNILEGSGATPNDHLRSGPNCCVTFSTVGGVGEARGYPTIRARIVSPAGPRKAKILIFPAPDDHLARCPHSGMKISRRRRVDGARGCPTIHCGIVSPAGAQLVEIGVVSAPDDHLTACPHGCVVISGVGGVGAGSCPNVRDRVVPTARV